MSTLLDTEQPSPTASRSQKRRRAILDAALASFCEFGFSKTTMEDIRRRAGASTGSLYHHFKGKEQLAAELYLDGIRNYQRGLVQELREGREVREVIHAIVSYHLSWIEQHPDWARYLMQSREAAFVKATKPALRRLNRDMVRRLADWMEPFVAAGEIDRLPEELYAALLVGPAQNFARAYLSGRARTDIKNAAEILAEASWRALRKLDGDSRED